MDLLKDAWNWVCGIVKTALCWIQPIWDWVKTQVEEHWSILKNKSTHFVELYGLRLLAKELKNRMHGLYNKLSPADRKELDDLINVIDKKS